MIVSFDNFDWIHNFDSMMDEKALNKNSLNLKFEIFQFTIYKFDEWFEWSVNISETN